MTPEIRRSVETVQLRKTDTVITQYEKSEEFACRCKTDNSKLAYQGDLKNFGQFCQTNGVMFVEQLKPETVNSWVLKMREMGRSEVTISRKVSSLKGFLDFACQKNLLSWDIFESFPKFKITPRGRLQILTSEQIKTLIAKTSQREDKRDAVLIRIALETGAKTSEIVDLKAGDVTERDTGEVAIKFEDPKGEHTRTIILSESGGELVKGYIAQKKLKLEQPLFPAHRPLTRENLTRQGFWLIIRDYGRRIGVPDLHPTTLRNTFAVGFSGSIKEKAKILGISERRVMLKSREMAQPEISR